MAYQSVNPFDGKVLKTFEECTDKQVEAALDRAERCYRRWSLTTFSARAAVAHKAATIMRDRVDEFARLMTLEMGKLIEESRGEVALSADIIDYYAEHAERFLAVQPLAPSSPLMAKSSPSSLRNCAANPAKA